MPPYNYGQYIQSHLDNMILAILDLAKDIVPALAKLLARTSFCTAVVSASQVSSSSSRVSRFLDATGNIATAEKSKNEAECRGVEVQYRLYVTQSWMDHCWEFNSFH